MFDSPKDAFVWDVSHQAYTHKILTNRNNEFSTIRQKGGISGFTKFNESEHDWFDAGHASTSISSALGLLAGRKISGEDGKVIAILGDGALTGGMAFEALSHAGQISNDLIVVLNDNQMSINGNTGSISRYLSKLTATAEYQSFRNAVDRFIDKIPLIGKKTTKLIFRTKRAVKGLVFSNNIFSDLGFEYVGPLNGHSIPDLIKVFEKVKNLDKPVVLHIITKKGRGYEPAEKDPVAFHGVAPKSNKIEKNPSFTKVFGNKIVDLAQKNDKIVAITAAMTDGTGLTTFAEQFPNRFFDVGIAEEHAVTFAGGLARAGLKPVVAIYSTFIQRSVDQLIHDIALQNIPAVFVLDRSGPVPADGETHQGIFDISLLRPIPNVFLLTPASQIELENCLEWAIKQEKSVVIRYPKAECPAELPEFAQAITLGQGVLIPHEKTATQKADILFVCTGGIIDEVQIARDELAKENKFADIYNLRFLKPLDKDHFIEVAKNYDRIFFVEDGIRIGGIGTYLESLLYRTFGNKKTLVSGFSDRFLPQGTRKEILQEARLTGELLAKKAHKLWD